MQAMIPTSGPDEGICLVLEVTGFTHGPGPGVFPMLRKGLLLQTLLFLDRPSHFSTLFSFNDSGLIGSHDFSLTSHVLSSLQASF